MNIQTFFLIVIVLILVYYLPNKNDVDNNKLTSQTQQMSNLYGLFDLIGQLILPNQQVQTSTYVQPNSNSQTIINEYLDENECK